MPETRTLERFGEKQKEQIKDALRDGLAGRRAVMRAYENMAERVSDSETRTMLRRFADEERQEHEAAERICQRYGVDAGAIEGIRAEVAAFLGKMLVGGQKPPYSDVRDLTLLYGVESSGHVGASFLVEPARALGDDDWTRAIERSRERAASHLDYLKGRIEELSRQAFPSTR